MTPDPFPRSRLIAGYDEPPLQARIRGLLTLAVLAPQPVPDGAIAFWLTEFDFDPDHNDPVAGWRAVTNAETCAQCQRGLHAGDGLAVTARGRRLCAACAP